MSILEMPEEKVPVVFLINFDMAVGLGQLWLVTEFRRSPLTQHASVGVDPAVGLVETRCNNRPLFLLRHGI